MNNKFILYKINIQKLIAFLYVAIKESKNEIQKTIIFTMALKKKKIVRNYLNKRSVKFTY